MEAEVLNKKKLFAPKLRFKGFDKEWRQFFMKDVATKITDGTHDTPKQISIGIPYLTAIHVKDGVIDFDNCYYLNKNDHDIIYKRCNPEHGDLLLVNIGAGTATCASVTVDYEFSLKNVALIKPNRSIINPDFLSQLQRKNTKKLFLQLTAGGAQPFLSLKELSKLKINTPSLSEQKKIASFLSSIDEKINQLKRKWELLELYKKGVMQQLFSGKLRFKDENGKEYPEWEEKKLREVLDYIQPTKYLVESTEYNDLYQTPVLTAGKTFILGYTNESKNIYCENLPVILFDDFTTATQFVNFPFKAKSSAMKILVAKEKANIVFVYLAMQLIKFEIGGHGRHWISQYSLLEIPYPSLEEQNKIATYLSTIDSKIKIVDIQIKQTQSFKKGLLQQMFV